MSINPQLEILLKGPPPAAKNKRLWKIVCRNGAPQAVHSYDPKDIPLAEMWAASDDTPQFVLHAWFQAYPPAYRHLLRDHLLEAGIITNVEEDVAFTAWAWWGTMKNMQEAFAKQLHTSLPPTTG